MTGRTLDRTAPRRRWPWTVMAVALASAAAAGIRTRARHRTGVKTDGPARKHS